MISQEFLRLCRKMPMIWESNLSSGTARIHIKFSAHVVRVANMLLVCAHYFFGWYNTIL